MSSSSSRTSPEWKTRPTAKAKKRRAHIGWNYRCDFSCFFPRKSDHVPGDTLRSEKTKKNKKSQEFSTSPALKFKSFWSCEFSQLPWPRLAFHGPPPPKAALKIIGNGKFSPGLHISIKVDPLFYFCYLSKNVERMSSLTCCVLSRSSRPPRRCKNSRAAIQEPRKGDPFKTSDPKTIKKPTLDVKSCRSKPLNQSWIHPNRLKCNLMYHVQHLESSLKGNFSSFPLDCHFQKKKMRKKKKTPRIREFLRDQVSHWHFTWRR